MHRKAHRTSLLALAAAVVLALAACGSQVSFSSSSENGAVQKTTTNGQVTLAKTKFVLHAGLAFGAFHHFIWKPFKRGDLSHPLSHKLTAVKAGLAVGFVYHELRLALHDAQSSKTLSRLVAPITSLDNRFHGLGGQLKQGQGAEGAITQDDNSVGSIEQIARGAGQPITEQTPSNV